jgi:hypothetical protein
MSVLDADTKERVGISVPDSGSVIVLKDDKGKDFFKQPLKVALPDSVSSPEACPFIESEDDFF